MSTILNRFKHLSFGMKIILIAISFSVMGLITVKVVWIYQVQKSAELAILEESRALVNQAHGARNFILSLQSHQTFDAALLKEAQQAVAQSGARTQQEIIEAARKTRFYQTIPIVASWSIGNGNAKDVPFQFRVPRIQARNPENEATPIEREMLKIMEEEKRKEYWRIDEKIQALRYMKPIILDKACLLCHGTVEDYPQGNGYDPLGIKMEGWKEGEQRGAYEIVYDLAPMQEEIRHITWEIVGLGAVILFLTFAGINYTVKRFAIRPIRELRVLFGRVADGDLTIAPPSSESHDDIGQALKATEQMTEGLRTIFMNMAGSIRTLNQSAQKLDAVSGTMLKNIEHLNDKSVSVSAESETMSATIASVKTTSGMANDLMTELAHSAEESNSNMATISAAAEESSTNLSAVAAASEEASTSLTQVQQAAERTNGNVNRVAGAVREMGKAFEEIKERCERANTESREAESIVHTNQEGMDRLASSSREIGDVVEMIKSIAEQIKMLSLNASIEAAGAGDAGAGFSVVANEVKSLAAKTEESTILIEDKIGHIQELADEVSHRTEQVTTIVRKISASNLRILSSVQEQSLTLKSVSESTNNVARETEEVTRRVAESNEGISEVARNVSEISVGIQEVTRSVAAASTGIESMSHSVVEAKQGNTRIVEQMVDAAQASSKVTASMESVKTAAEEMIQLSSEVASQAKEMSTIAAALDDMVNRFKL